MRNRIIQSMMKYGRYNLQIFADDPAGEDGADEGADKGGEDKDDDPSKKDEDKGEKTFTQAELDRIVKERLERERKANQQAIKDAKAEAAKYAKMSEEERRKADEAAKQKEIDDLKAENARLQAEALRTELGKSAAADLEKKDITVTPDILELVVGADAEATKSLTDKFIKAVLADRKAQEVKRATKNTPKGYGSGGSEPDPFAARMKKYGR